MDRPAFKEQIFVSKTLGVVFSDENSLLKVRYAPDSGSSKTLLVTKYKIKKIKKKQ